MADFNFGLEASEIQFRLNSIPDKLDKTSVVNDLSTGGAEKALSAEQGKVLSTSISALTTDTQFLVTNLVTNGDFSNGTTGWSAYNGTISANNGVLSFTASVTNGFVKCSSLRRIINNKYYIRARIKTTSNAVGLCSIGVYIGNNHSGSGNFENISTIFTAISTISDWNIGIVDKRTSGWDTIESTNYMVIDLTAAFGAGNEPTQAEMDAMLAFYPNSWFDGTVNMAQNPKLVPYLLNAIRSKADKAQEAWITPTLLNGWISYDTSRTLKYRKDALGKVQIRGVVKSGAAGSIIFTLPAGYRPTAILYFTGNAENTGSCYFSIDTSGNVSLTKTASTSHDSLDTISFFVD